MVNANPLPETQKPREYSMNNDTALGDYILMRSVNAIQVAKAVGVTLNNMSYRIYTNRIMWRLTFDYDDKLTREEVKRIVWDVAVKGLGAYEPETYKGDDPALNQVVVVWFTDGGKQALSGIQF